MARRRSHKAPTNTACTAQDAKHPADAYDAADKRAVLIAELEAFRCRVTARIL